ncbi:integrase, catalytic region, zinc finger, CCHC-type containing protein [Tanacetum coccineum]
MNMGQDRQMLWLENVGNHNRLIVVPGIANPNAKQNRNGNFVAAQAEGNGNGNNKNQIRCYNCRGMGHLTRNCIVRPRRRDAAYLQRDLDEIEEVNANCIFMVICSKHRHRVLRLIKLPYMTQMDQLSVEHNRETVEQYPATVEETHAYFESLYINLAIKVEKVNTVNRKLKETNAELTTELARYKNQENYDKLERCYQKSVYQEKCLTKKINALHLRSTKMITTLNEEIANLNNQLSKEK